MTSVAAATSAASRFALNARMAEPAAASAMPNARASSVPTRRSGSGRSRVRIISASVSRSYTWFSTAAPPATSAVPPTASAIGVSSGADGRAQVVAGGARRHDEHVQPRLGERDVSRRDVRRAASHRTSPEPPRPARSSREPAFARGEHESG